MADTIPSLATLPLQGIDDDLQTVTQVRTKLKATQTILKQITGNPHGLPTMLKQALENVLFHVNSGLLLIEDFLQSGNASDSKAWSVPGLQSSIINHRSQITKAYPLWDTWAASEKLVQPIPKAGALAPADSHTPDASTKQSSFLQDASKPTPLSTYLIIGALGFGFYLLTKK